MIKDLYQNYISFIKKHKLQPIVDVVYFAILLFGFHLIWKYWESNGFRFFTDKSIIIPVYELLTNLAFNTSEIFISLLLKNHYYIENLTWYFDNNTSITIIYGCGGLKAFLQFTVIIILFPGPIKKKAWFIPVGLIILFITNVIRILGLCLTMYYYKSDYDFVHNNPQKVFFYGVIFLLWIIWVEKFKNPKIT